MNRLPSLFAQVELDSTYVGPAVVTRIAGEQVEVAFSEQQVWAQMALAIPYYAEVGDKLLIIGKQEGFYVIGVIEGSGKHALSVEGDLLLQARNGKIQLQSDKEISLASTSVSVKTVNLSLIAEKCSEKFTRASRWVLDLLRIDAGRTQTSVKEESRTQAKRILQRAEEDVQIDGSKINLG